MSTFRITFSPQRSDDELHLEKQGDTLVVNGTRLDLNACAWGKVSCNFLTAPPIRTDDVWELSVILPHGPAAPEETRFPAAVTVRDDGPIVIPPYGPRVQTLLSTGTAKKFLPPAPKRFKKPNDAPNLSTFYFDPSALDAIQDSRSAIGESIAYWAATDMHLRTFLLTRFGPDAAAVSDVIDQHAKSDNALASLLRIAAAMTGDTEITAECQRFLQRRGQVKAFRDAFAHGSWLLSSDFPSAIILMSATEARNLMTDAMAMDIFEFSGLKAQFEVWKAEDFHRARTCSAALRNEAIELIGRFPPTLASAGLTR